MSFVANHCRLRDHLTQTAARFDFKPGVCLAGVGFAALLVMGMPGRAGAFNVYDGSSAGNNLEINLDTTISYTGFERVNNPSKVLLSPIGNANGSEGDLAFQHGIVGNQFEILPVLDVKDGDFGAHVSADAFINTVYLQHNQNNQPGTFNPLSTTNNRSFTSATRNVDGLNARLLDAFLYGSQQFGDGQSIQLKVGRQTLLWGQSLFFTGNGIAAGQAPIDVITAQNLANPQAQQVFLPVGQAVLTYHPNSTYTIQGYYQFEYMHYQLQGVGAYFNGSDLLDAGGQRLIVGPGAYFLRVPDLKPPSQDGRFGLSVQATWGNYDVGLYGLRYDAQTPEVYAFPGQGFLNPTPGGVQVGTYKLVYPRAIQIYGTSISTTIGPANVAAEVSGRIHMPLVPSGLGIQSAQNQGNANGDPLYPVGDTVAAQASAIYLSAGLPLMPGGFTLDGEVEFNHLVTVTQNRAALATGRQASAAAFDISITPTYFDVLPNLEVDFPVGIIYNFLGSSEIDSSMQHGTGSFNVGVTATYKGRWIAGLTYKDFLGRPNASLNNLADRGYVSLNLQHTF